MKPPILSKLGEELAEEIQSERQVVYIMVEVRKLLEIEKQKRRYPALTFHCDWVAHPSLERELAEEIVRAFNKQQKLTERRDALKLGETMAVDNSHWELLGPTVTMTNFRNEFGAYLHTHNLDASITQTDRKWANFLKYYGRVIEDCPLRCKGPKLKYVDEVSVRVDKLRPETTAKIGFTIQVKWSWKSKTNGTEWYMPQLY